MNRACEFSGDFPSLMKAPADDPFWTHVRSCPDCQALFNAYREFETPGPEVDLDFDLDEADNELAARLDSALESLVPPIAQVIPISSSSRWWNRKELWYGLAAVMVAGTGIFLSQDLMTGSEPEFGGDSGVVRGTESLADQYPCTRDQGLLQLNWPEQAGSDLVRLVMFDGAMTELASFSSDQAGPFQITDPVVLQQAAYAQVLYLSQGDVLRRGPLIAIPADQ